MAVATYLPSTVYFGAASGSAYPSFYSPNTNTNSAGYFEAVSVVASLTSSTSPYSVTLQYNLGTTSTAALTLRTIYMANSSSTSGTVKLTPNDGVTAIGNSIAATSLTAETQISFTSTAADVTYQNNTVLSASPSSAGILTVRIDFNSTGAWTSAAVANFQFSVTQ